MARAIGLVLTLAVMVILPMAGTIANLFLHEYVAKKRNFSPQKRWESINFVWSIYLVMLVVELTVGVCFGN